MPQIRLIEPGEETAAKRLIYRIAREVFHNTRALEELIDLYESNGELRDMDDIRRNYFENGGTFLVTTNAQGIIGTGAIRYIDEGVCELKRLWLETSHHGLGLGYRMMQELLMFARGRGYTRMRLKTDAVHQKRAVGFYKQLGFIEVRVPQADSDEDIVMEMDL